MWLHYNAAGDDRDEDARRAFQALLIFTLKVPEGDHWEQFKGEVIERSFRNYNYNITEVSEYRIERLRMLTS